MKTLDIRKNINSVVFDEKKNEELDFIENIVKNYCSKYSIDSYEKNIVIDIMYNDKIYQILIDFYNKFEISYSFKTLFDIFNGTNNISTFSNFLLIFRGY